jgi:hypothetical protein
VVDQDAGPQHAAWPEAGPVETRIGASAACVDQSIDENVSENGINSQDAAFETWLSEQPWNRGSRGSGETALHEVVRKAIAISRLADRESPANGRESLGRAD